MLFTLTFDQCNAYFLNINTNSFKKKILLIYVQFNDYFSNNTKLLNNKVK